MKALTLPLKNSDFDTRGKRRQVCHMLSAEIMRIYEAEYAYTERIPPNISQGYRHLYARKATDDLLDAAIAAGEAFEPF